MQNKKIKTTFESFINSNDFQKFSDKSITESLRYENIEKINEGIIRDAMDSLKSLIRRGLNTVSDYMESASMMFGGIKNKIINTASSLFKGSRVIEVFDSRDGDMISQIIDRYQSTPAWKQWSEFINSGELSYPMNEDVSLDELEEERDRLGKLVTTAKFTKDGYANPEAHTGAKEITSVNDMMNILKRSYSVSQSSKLRSGSKYRAVVPYILGAPAIGKTALVAKFVEEVGGILVELRLGSLLPSDLKGLPFVDMDKAITMSLQKEINSQIEKYGEEFGINKEKIDKFTELGPTSNFAIPNLGFPLVNREVLDSEEYRNIFHKVGIGKDGIRPIIVYIDEFVQADKEVIDRANQLIQQGNVTGEEFTAPHVFMVATSNRPQDNPATIGYAPFWESGALKDRFKMYNFIPNAQDWIDWAESSNYKLLKQYGGKFSIKDVDKFDDDKVMNILGTKRPVEKPFSIHPDILDWFQDMDPNYEEKNPYKKDGEGGKVVYREQMFYTPVKFGAVAPSPRRWEALSDWYTELLWDNNIDSIFDLKAKSPEYKALMDEIKFAFIDNVGVIAYAEWEKFVETRMTLDKENIDLALENPNGARLERKFLDVISGGVKTKNRILEYIMKSYLFKKSNGNNKKYLEYALNLAIYLMRHGSGELFKSIFSSINSSQVLKDRFGVPESVNIKDTSKVKYYTTVPTWFPTATGAKGMSFDNQLASVNPELSIETGIADSVKVKATDKVWVNPVTGTPYAFVNQYIQDNANDPKLVEKGFYITSTNLLLRTGELHTVPGIKKENVKDNRNEDDKFTEIKLDDNGCYMHGGDKYFCEVYTPEGILDADGNYLPLNDILSVRAHVVIYKNNEVFEKFEFNKKVETILTSSVF